MPRGVKKENLPTKDCVTCNRPFTWRKKWERCWDEVTTCSKSCNSVRRGRRVGGAADDEKMDAGPLPDVNGGLSGLANFDDDVQTSRQERKAATKAMKARKREKREGRAVPRQGQKPCELCSNGSDLLVRCTVDASGEWLLVCGKCWKGASGGITDGDFNHPHYRYGGLWKNRGASASMAKKAKRFPAATHVVAAAQSDSAPLPGNTEGAEDLVFFTQLLAESEGREQLEGLGNSASDLELEKLLSTTTLR